MLTLTLVTVMVTRLFESMGTIVSPPCGAPVVCALPTTPAAVEDRIGTVMTEVMTAGCCAAATAEEAEGIADLVTVVICVTVRVPRWMVVVGCCWLDAADAEV